jgi:hypothetical protein
VPYDAILRIGLFDRSFEVYDSFLDKKKDPLSEVFRLHVMIDNECDKFYGGWNYKGIKECLQVLDAHVPENANQGLRYMVQKLKDVVEKVEHLRTIHVMDRWDLDKTLKQENIHTISLDKLLGDIEEIKNKCALVKSV